MVCVANDGNAIRTPDVSSAPRDARSPLSGPGLPAGAVPVSGGNVIRGHRKVGHESPPVRGGRESGLKGKGFQNRQQKINRRSDRKPPGHSKRSTGPTLSGLAGAPVTRSVPCLSRCALTVEGCLQPEHRGARAQDARASPSPVDHVSARQLGGRSLAHTRKGRCGHTPAPPGDQGVRRSSAPWPDLLDAPALSRKMGSSGVWSESFR
jgi:hypothetical protein